MRGIRNGWCRKDLVYITYKKMFECSVNTVRKYEWTVWVYISLDIVRSWSSDYAVGLVEELGYCHQLKS